MATQLGSKPSMIVLVKVNHPGLSEKPCQRVLTSCFCVKPGSDTTDGICLSVIIALEEKGYMHVSLQLWREYCVESCEGHVSELTPPPGMCACTIEHSVASCYACLANFCFICYFHLFT